MRTYGCVSAALLAVFFAGCNRIAEPVMETDSKLVFHACWAESKDTRTALQGDGTGTSVWWSPRERISVFFGGYATTYTQAQFTSTNTSPAQTVNFEGYLPILIGSQEAEQNAPVHWAVYPYDATNSCDGTSVTLSVSANQAGTENTFAEQSFPSVATSRDFTLAFYNVCGGVRFSVTRLGIESVEFKSIGGEPLAGRVQVGFGSAGVPVVQQVLEGFDTVTLTAPEGGFVPGKYYFAALLPQRLSQGLSAVFHKGGSTASVSKDKEIVINRSRFGKLDELDKGLEFVDETNPSDAIVFADPFIKASCLDAGFDTNEDGEISYEEAAAVKSIEGVFTGTDYVSFNELQYFTGITEIPSTCFANKVKLQSIRLPEGVLQIGKYAFYGCSELTTIHFPRNLSSIGVYAFKECRNLNRVDLDDIMTWMTVVFEQLVDEISSNHYYFESWPYGSFPFNCSPYGGHLYLHGQEVLNLIIPQGVTAITDWRFDQCMYIEQITLPKGFKELAFSAFTNCNVRYVDAPSVDDWLAIAFPDINGTFFGTHDGYLSFAGEAAIVVTIPDVERIGDYAFHRCKGIERFIMTSLVPPAIGTLSFGTETPIYVPAASYDAYCEAWPDLANRIFASE